MATFCFRCVTSFFLRWKNKETLIIFKIMNWSSSNLAEGGILGPEFKFTKNFHVWRHFDVTTMKRQNTCISETEKLMTSLWRHFQTKTLCTRTFHKTVFARTKFGLVRMKGGGGRVKRGRRIPLRSERVFYPGLDRVKCGFLQKHLRISPSWDQLANTTD